MKEFVLSGAGARKPLIDYVSALNDEQLAVVTSGDGPCLVLAGAGTGKTRTITYRVAWLLEQGVEASNILLVTFTNKAAREMATRVEELLGHYPVGLWSGTFHSVANRILRQNAQRVGFTPSFSILSQEDAEDLMEICVKEVGVDTKRRRFPKPGVLAGIYSFARNRDQSLFDVISEHHSSLLPSATDILRVAELYQSKKKEQNSMDFDDLLIHLRNLLAEDHDFRVQLSQQFRYVLVDEFQDTNVIQAQIVAAISSQHGNVLVVGDDAQSIYSFRAAEIRNILDFPNHHSGSKVYRLTYNYRSTPEILRLANASITNNTDQFDKELRAFAPSGELPSVVPAAHPSQEAAYIAEQILQLRDEGVALADMAVLFRAAFHSQALEFELMKRDIPYDYRGGLKFFERAHIKDAIAFVRLFANTRDAMAWVRVLRLYPGIGLVTANSIGQNAAALNDMETILSRGDLVGKRAAAGWESCRNLLSKMYGVRDNATELLRLLAADDDYRGYLTAQYENAEERIEDLEQFAIFSEQFDNIGDFLDMVALTDEFGVARAQASAEDHERLVLSTVHQAKGLEWNTVFIMHACEGSFPHNRAFSDARAIEEERRLFYVAVTRAKRRLFITYPQTVGYDHVEFRQPSVFIQELPAETYEEIRLRQSFSGYGGGGSFGRGSISGRGGGNTVFSAPSFGDDQDSIIVLDDMGERSPKQAPPSSFLRDLDEL